MTVQPIRLFGDPVLRTPADPVVDFDAELRRLVADLVDTMQEQEGAGLAAPQLGVGLRVFAFDVDDVVGHLINPVLEFPDEEEQDGPEGCLSIPGIYVDTKRRMNVVASGLQPARRPGAAGRHRADGPVRPSTRPTTSTGCCSSTGSTPPPARRR